MSKPNSEQLQANIPPITRLYIDAKIAEAMEPIAAAIKAMADQQSQAVNNLTNRLNELHAKQDSMARRYAEDDRLALTKARIAQFIEDTQLK